MKFSTVEFMVLALPISISHAWMGPQALHRNQNLYASPTVLSASTSSLPSAATAGAKATMVSVVERISAQEGLFVANPKAKADLTLAVQELEAVAGPPSRDDYDDYFAGDWILQCTTVATEKSDALKNFPEIPFLKEGPLKDIRQSLNRQVTVLQKIPSNDPDRIDHVIEFTPLSALTDVFANVPEPLSSLSLNPLDLTKSVVTLVHKATVESIVPKLLTKLSLQSIVLNVAGKSQLLDPQGADVLGINVPLGEFIQAGSFETTYLDEEWRVSRSQVGPIDQLRVFRKKSSESTLDPVDEDYFPSDVEWVGDEVETATDGTGPEGQDVDVVVNEDFVDNDDNDYPSDVEM